MKRIFFIILLFHMTEINSQKFSQDQISFSSQLQNSNPIFSSDRSIYLSPDSQTPNPFYSLNNINKFPSNFLPQSQSKAPTHFSTPFSVMLSSTLRPNTEDDDDDDDDEHEERYNYRNLIPNFTLNNHVNHTVKKIDRQPMDKRDTPANSRMNNVPPQHEKHPNQYVSIGPKDTSSKQNGNFVQNPAARRMIVTSELQRSDHGPDHLKAGSFQNTQYVQAPGVFISSTTEPAIPILRLSNEMDLDGSFSYEALGADQTHYVQHSRMENMGTDKEEQVVEGSYSYVGDDGRTYTVHYVADSNGYRATGEHLPSPPPIPEIIQRAVQYNLAEEARKPPHVRLSWENEENEYQNKEESRHHAFSILPLQRNLFTGKTPEAFSFGFANNANPPSSLVTASNFHVPSKANHEPSHDQLKSKINNGPISPQVTFLASQGAHNPSLHQQQPQPTMQNTDSDKSTLPQLMNYEARIKESEHEGNKGLWRWQYGLNANGNQIPSKNSISRSFGEGDDVIINFSDMTPEQYTQMIQAQMSAVKDTESNKMEGDNVKQYFASPSNTIQREKDTNNNEKRRSVTIINNTINDKTQIDSISTQSYDFYRQEPVKFDTDSKSRIYQYINPITDNPAIQQHQDEINTRPKIISINNFAPRSQMVTQSYNFEETQFEPTKINMNNENSTVTLNSEYQVSSLRNNEYKYSTELHEDYTTPLSNIDINVTPFNYYQSSEPSRFKPIIYKSEYKQENSQVITTTEPTVAELIKDNIFLRNLFKTPHSKEKLKPDSLTEEKNQYQFNKPELTTDKPAQVIEITQNPLNEIKNSREKPLNINDVLNYVVMKNHFESIKTKPKSKSTHTIQYINHLKEKEPTRYIPVKEHAKNQEDIREDNKEYAALSRQQQQELRGFIKNYKVLQRQKNMGQKNQMSYEPQRHIKAFHPPGLPPLGRAGPSMKSYSPPAYV